MLNVLAQTGTEAGEFLEGLKAIGAGLGYGLAAIGPGIGIGTVVGNVWATKKEATLSGLRLLVVRPYTTDGRESAETLVAVDPIGAGIGERVLVVFGRAARHAIGRGHDIGFQTDGGGAG